MSSLLSCYITFTMTLPDHKESRKKKRKKKRSNYKTPYIRIVKIFVPWKKRRKKKRKDPLEIFKGKKKKKKSDLNRPNDSRPGEKSIIAKINWKLLPLEGDSKLYFPLMFQIAASFSSSRFFLFLKKNFSELLH